MKKNTVPRVLIIVLTGLCFAAYFAYYVYYIIREGSVMSPLEIIISSLVLLSFAVFTVFSFTSIMKPNSLRFLVIRRTVLIIALITVFLLKLRMLGTVIAYLDPSMMHTILYCCSYFLTQIALMLLLVYYAFILKKLDLYPKASVLLPLSAMILFLCSFILEIILFFAYGIGLENSPLRTVVSRSVFYLGFTGLSAYFLFPPIYE